MTLTHVEREADCAVAFCTSLKMHPAAPKSDSFSKTLCDKRKLNGPMGVDSGVGMKNLARRVFLRRSPLLSSFPCTMGKAKSTSILPAGANWEIRLGFGVSEKLEVSVDGRESDETEKTKTH